MNKKRKAALQKHIEKNMAWLIMIVVFAVLDIFIIYPLTHKSAYAGYRNTVNIENKQTGWVEIQDRKYYYNEKGTKTRGFAEIDGKKYYFDERVGYLKNGWVTEGENRHYYTNDGMAIGKLELDDGKYYFDENGNMQVGWITKDDKKYYYDTDGKQVFGQKEIDGKTCFFSSITGEYVDIQFDPNKPMVALTWDDGPANATAPILDALESVGGRGTFFIVGNRVDKYKDVLKRLVGMNCEVANHTWEHVYLNEVDSDEIVNQMKMTNDKLEEVTGVRPVLMRPTGGRVTPTVKEYVGMPMIYWSLDTLDWKTKNASKTIEAVLNNVQDGSIVLMHDLQDSTGEACKTIIPELVKRGYQLVTVSELAMARGIQLENGVVYYDMYPKKEQE